MKGLIEYTEHSMTSLKDTLSEGLLDMDEKAADKAVINSNLKKIIKQFNQYNPNSSKFDYYDVMGREVKVGDIILTENMELGSVIGFGKGGWASQISGVVYFSTDGEQHDDFDNSLGVSSIKCGYFIKIPDIKILKDLLK